MIRRFLTFSPVLVLAGMAAALPAQNTPAPDGAALFRQRCSSCHSVTPGARAVLGPNLAGVVGRKAGSTAFNHTPAFKKLNLTWDRANLDRYLSGPTKMVPGSRMVITVSDPRQRRAIVDFLSRRP